MRKCPIYAVFEILAYKKSLGKFKGPKHDVPRIFENYFAKVTTKALSWPFRLGIKKASPRRGLFENQAHAL